MPDSTQLSIAAAATVGASAVLYLCCGACGGGDGGGGGSKWAVVRGAVGGGGRKSGKSQAMRRKELGMSPAKYASFMSHAKAEAAMEARFVQMQLEDRQQDGKMATDLPIFLDSDDLKNLDELEEHVRMSEVLVLLQTEKVLTRPWCVLELVTALDAGVPIVGLTLVGKGYDFAEAEHYLANIDTMLDKITPGGSQLLESKGVDMKEAAHKLSNAIPKIISIQLNTGASRNVLAATVDDLVETIENAESPPPPREDCATWLQQRDQKNQQTHALTGRKVLDKAKAIPSLSTIAFLIQAIESAATKLSSEADDGSSHLVSIVPLLEEDITQLPNAELGMKLLDLAKFAGELENVARHVQMLMTPAAPKTAGQQESFTAVCAKLKASVLALGVAEGSESTQALDLACGVKPAQASSAAASGQLASSAPPPALHGAVSAGPGVPPSPGTMLRENQQMVAQTAKQQKLLEMQNKVLMEQVAQMQAMMDKQSESGMKLQDALAAHPIPIDEAERRIVLAKTNLMDLELPNAGLDTACQRALRAVNAVEPKVLGVLFNVIGEHKQRNVAMAQILKDGRMFETNRMPAGMLNGGEEAQTARKMSACQYVVATGEMQCFNPDQPSHMALPQLPGSDGTGTDHKYYEDQAFNMEEKAATIRASGVMDAEGAAEDSAQDVSQDLMALEAFKWLYKSTNNPEEYSGILGYLKGAAGRTAMAAMPADHREFMDLALRLFNGDSDVTYAGVPVFCQGVVLGSCCFLCDGLEGGLPSDSLKALMKQQAGQLSNDIEIITMGAID
jgi:hypothetical protein